MNKTSTIARMRNNTLVRVKRDGTEEALDIPSLSSLGAAEIQARAIRDLQNPPCCLAAGDAHAKSDYLKISAKNSFMSAHERWSAFSL